MRTPTLAGIRIVRLLPCLIGLSWVIAVSDGSAQQAAPNGKSPVSLTYAKGQNWTDADRQSFYTTSQGSHLIPYAWFKALRRLDNNDFFAADQLQRYGYLSNGSPTNIHHLPIGFVIDGDASSGQLGMTCAACHTGQLEYEKDGTTHALRIDGAPTNADFQQFLSDLVAVTQKTASDTNRFDDFAKTVLGSRYSAESSRNLKADFTSWVDQFSDFMSRSLPASPWGPGRLDAFGMIFNRVAARDLDIPDNFKKADAPVSYPFLWNAAKQDHTQWPGSVPNGLFFQGLARNTGEVFGVFADFKPRKRFPNLIDHTTNSADFVGLQQLEEKVASLQPPAWPREIFPIDDALAAKGKVLFAANCSHGCHEEKSSTQLVGAWATPRNAVGTDPKMILNASRLSDAGLYTGTLLPPSLPPHPSLVFARQSSTTDILAGSVIGSLLDEALSHPLLLPGNAKTGVWRAVLLDLKRLTLDQDLHDVLGFQVAVIKRFRELTATRLANLYTVMPIADKGAQYEARVLHGIWATAPYLHNGSVPNLWELLLPAKQRSTSFKVGSRMFDAKNVGYATDSSPFINSAFITDPKNANGNGNGGHQYGSNLSEDDRWAIIEYLKTL